MSKFLFPMGWQALNFQLWQSDHNKHLPARDQELPIAWSINAESAPKSAPLETLELAMNQKQLEATPVHEFVDMMVI